METVKGLALAILISLSMTFIFSYLLYSQFNLSFQQTGYIRGLDIAHDLEASNQQAHLPVFLERKELVPFLLNVNLNYPYKKIKLEHRVLLIDVSVQELDNRDIYADAYQLLKTVMQQTNNVDYLFVRFILTTQPQDQLLLYMPVVRHQRLMKALEDEPTQAYVSLFLKEYTKLVYGTGWR
jgi:hypothetical protein